MLGYLDSRYIATDKEITNESLRYKINDKVVAFSFIDITDIKLNRKRSQYWIRVKNKKSAFYAYYYFKDGNKAKALINALTFNENHATGNIDRKTGLSKVYEI